MNNIYKHTHVSNTRISEMSDKDLHYLMASSDDAMRAITKGIASIGNLAHAAVNSEEYSQDDAMNDLEKIAHLLTVLPLVIEAEHDNYFGAFCEIKERRQIKKQRQ
ncbi:hypothetical protein [Xenorhabdus littoralis]|uniref:hypothetical protein n=1 Tax=Xenorhabdus littoralis TaxID=2582835 RepID=UPI0029E7F1F8|nr:hypothetical protein [Xenorhabdus sp. psl]MDX7993290.1 hypothetical protein [Xenorhabdus sp. psl]